MIECCKIEQSVRTRISRSVLDDIFSTVNQNLNAMARCNQQRSKRLCPQSFWSLFFGLLESKSQISEGETKGEGWWGTRLNKRRRGFPCLTLKIPFRLRRGVQNNTGLVQPQPMIQMKGGNGKIQPYNLAWGASAQTRLSNGGTLRKNGH